MCVCVCACVCAWVRACVRACVCFVYVFALVLYAFCVRVYMYTCMCDYICHCMSTGKCVLYHVLSYLLIRFICMMYAIRK